MAPPRRIAWTLTPLELLDRWPASAPLMLLHSGRRHDRWARWSVAATPRGFYRFDGRSHWTGERPATAPGFTHDPLRDLDALVAATAVTPDAASELPFHGGWIGYVSFDLGRVLEPRAVHPTHGAIDDRRWPLLEFAWCPGAILYDHADGTWWAVGDVEPPALTVKRADRAPAPIVGDMLASADRAAHLAAVRRTIEYIGAGDIYQANITHRLTASFEGSTRRFCANAIERSAAWYGAYLEWPGGRTIGSLSPELFLEVDAADASVVTRPIKGTRPASVDPAELAASAKDAAELHMIVDLLRNDLGRVCRVGSMRVTEPRTIEQHPTVHHGVAEVTGTLRDGTSVGDVLRAVMPGGSVVGVPKIRALQIIDELEPVRRGPYCGAIGYLDAAGDAAFSIAIRTLLLSGIRPPDRWDQLTGRVDYGVGGGIVADSDPDAEWQETLDKAAVLAPWLSASG